MRFYILIFLYSGLALAQTHGQGTWSADNDNPPGLEEARAKNYEKNLRPPQKHPPAYYTTDYYEYQVDRKVTFESDPINESIEKKEDLPEESSSSTSPKITKKTKKSFAGGGYVQGRRITSKNCTYTCNKKLPVSGRKGHSKKEAKKGLKYKKNSFWAKKKSPSYTFSKTHYKRRKKRNSSFTFFKKKSPVRKTRKYTSPIITKKKHIKKPSISKKVEGSALR